MYKFSGISALALVAISAPAYAGEEVQYEATPDWVVEAAIDPATIDGGPSDILYDWQHRLDNGMVHEYGDRVVRIDNPTSLRDEGTLQYTWAPDKGDLFIHRFEILREGEIIDLAAQGVEFDIIRREQGLESRLLDGRLTATVAVPGLREGDVLRVAHSITLSDQALGDEVQALQYLPSEPWRVGQARTIMSWPVGSDIAFRAEGAVVLPTPVVRGGYNFLKVDLPLAERDEMPGDAPSRFSQPYVLRAGSFASWQELSMVMEPHFTQAAMIVPGGKLSAEVAKIAAESDDPLERTALAVRLVQDQVSYLLNGLDGGNYLPQTAEETWEKRYGDCKAKSVLLMAVLRQLGIEADVVLVASEGGDALPDLLPIPANFDHMIVKADIDGVEYWLDGTSTATRLNNLANVPPFHYALTLRPEGADLAKMEQRPRAFPDMSAKVVFDHTAGIDLPALFNMEISISGAQGASIQAAVDEDDPEVIKAIGESFGERSELGAQVTSVALSYDEDKAVGTVIIKGVSSSMFEFERGEMTLDVASADNVSFSPNRVQRKWRGIPVATDGSYREHSKTRILLPQNGQGFTFSGVEQFNDRFATTQLVRNASLANGEIRVEEQTIRELGEIAVADLAIHRRAALRISKSDLTLNAPDDAVWRWDLSAADLRKRTQAAQEAYTTAVEKADKDDFSALNSRANFYRVVFDYANALRDLDQIIEEKPTADLFLSRANVLIALDDLSGAIANIQSAYELSPKNDNAYFQAEIMARNGDSDGALELLKLLPVSEDERDGFVDAQSFILGMAGDLDMGLAMLEERLMEKPESSTLLNASCWYRGIFKTGLEDAVAHCNRALERTQYPASLLDSRAMVHYAKGDHGAALTDLDAALKLAPGMSASRYLRGVILMERGDKEGRKLVESALRQSPQLQRYYANFGINPEL